MSSRPRKDAFQTSQLPLQPSMHRVQSPDWGDTFGERFSVSRHSLAFGCCRFTVQLSFFWFPHFGLYSSIMRLSPKGGPVRPTTLPWRSQISRVHSLRRSLESFHSVKAPNRILREPPFLSQSAAFQSGTDLCIHCTESNTLRCRTAAPYAVPYPGL